MFIHITLSIWASLYNYHFFPFYQKINFINFSFKKKILSLEFFAKKIRIYIIDTSFCKMIDLDSAADCNFYSQTTKIILTSESRNISYKGFFSEREKWFLDKSGVQEWVSIFLFKECILSIISIHQILWKASKELLFICTLLWNDIMTSSQAIFL